MTMRTSPLIRTVVVGTMLLGIGACAKETPPPPAPPPAEVAPPAPVEEALPPGVRDVQIARVQLALNKHGAKLKVDGRMGQKTRSALRKFQKQNKLRITGKADAATMTALGL